MHKLNIPIKLLICDSVYDRECFPLAKCVCVQSSVSDVSVRVVTLTMRQAVTQPGP